MNIWWFKKTNHVREKQVFSEKGEGWLILVLMVNGNDWLRIQLHILTLEVDAWLQQKKKFNFASFVSESVGTSSSPDRAEGWLSVSISL